MTKKGRDFESRLMVALEEWVGRHGKVVFFAQSKATRGGQFLMSQPCDILVDSATGVFNVGIEAKSVDVETSSAKYGMYFSHRYKPAQVLKQIEYEAATGRRMLFALELRNHTPPGREKGDYAYLLPVEVPYLLLAAGEKRLTYDVVDRMGVPIGEDGELDWSTSAVAQVNVSKDRLVLPDPDVVEL